MTKRKSTDADLKEPIPPARENECHFWIPRKRRYCHLAVNPHHHYCGQHAALEDKTRPGFVEVPGSERIPCPYDPGHNVAARALAKHLKICNKRPEPPHPYFCENINVSSPSSAASSPSVDKPSDPKAPEPAATTPRERLFDMPREAFHELAAKVRRLVAEITPTDLETVILSHPSMKERLAASGNGKHAIQQASLLGHINRQGMLVPGKLFLEFGAGKGELSKWLHIAVGESKHVLIDRGSFRQKFDANMKHSDSTWVERLSMDIKDLDLSAYPRTANQSMVAVSKHLCGAATDLTLRCIANFAEKSTNNGQIDGIIIALCCHHICRFGMYASPEFLARYDITESEFEFICVMSSWATCGSWEQRQAVENEGSADHQTNNDLAAEDPSEEHWTKMAFAEREALGLQCKQLLDLGRLDYVRTLGYDAELVKYVDRTKSLENVALVARRKA
ncbi:methyltransferase TRM13-domain-containing protein [Geranomyces variabilis]|nr:methyltransferase TRM13-domain-containing protein [Geranomyces variabilis]KAJ3133590.1 hypothetical protein HDU90_005668 [Geranomyces variabilis]